MLLLLIYINLLIRQVLYDAEQANIKNKLNRNAYSYNPTDIFIITKYRRIVKIKQYDFGYFFRCKTRIKIEWI